MTVASCLVGRATFGVAIALVCISEETAAQPADWLGVRTEMHALADRVIVVEPSQADMLESGDLRRICAASPDAFAGALLAHSIGSGRTPQVARGGLEALIRQVGDQAYVEARATRSQSPNSVYEHAVEFPDPPPDAGSELTYRLAADIWAYGDAVQRLAMHPDDDQTLIRLRMACGVLLRNTEFAVAWVAANRFPTNLDHDGEPQQYRQANALAFIAQHAPLWPGANSALREAAQVGFVEGRLFPRTFAIFLDTEREAFDGHQVVGTKTGCDEGAAIFEPPLVSADEADRVRAAYGLPSVRQDLEHMTRQGRCSDT